MRHFQIISYDKKALQVISLIKIQKTNNKIVAQRLNQSLSDIKNCIKSKY